MFVASTYAKSGVLTGDRDAGGALAQCQLLGRELHPCQQDERTDCNDLDERALVDVDWLFGATNIKGLLNELAGRVDLEAERTGEFDAGGWRSGYIGKASGGDAGLGENEEAGTVVKRQEIAGAQREFHIRGCGRKHGRSIGVGPRFEGEVAAEGERLGTADVHLEKNVLARNPNEWAGLHVEVDDNATDFEASTNCLAGGVDGKAEGRCW